MRLRVIVELLFAAMAGALLSSLCISSSRVPAGDPTPCFGYAFFATTSGKDLASIDQIRSAARTGKFETCVEYGVPWHDRSLTFDVYCRSRDIQKAVLAIQDNDELNHFVVTPAYGNTLSSSSVETNKALGKPRQMIVVKGMADDADIGRLGAKARSQYQALTEDHRFRDLVAGRAIVRSALMLRIVPSLEDSLALDAFFEIRRGRTERFQIMANGTVYYCGYFEEFPDRGNS